MIQHDEQYLGDATTTDRFIDPSEEEKSNTSGKRWSSGSERPRIKHSWTSIILALFLLLLPLCFAAVLCYLVYANLMRGTDDAASTSRDGRTRPIDRDYYYVRYSATRLVFISSLASTLALALMPFRMTLFSFHMAHYLKQSSKSTRTERLLTPFQFELSIRLLSAGYSDIWQYLKYVGYRRRTKVAVSPLLHRSAIVLGLTLLLATAVALVDALLHIYTSTVQFNTTVPWSDSSFQPGRRLSKECWNSASTLPMFSGCNFDSGGSGANPHLSNATQSYLTLGNASTTNFIQLADDGKTSIIVQSDPPSTSSYRAQSFASTTTCETVMKRCDPVYDYGGCTACQTLNWTCTPEGARLNYSSGTDAWESETGKSAIFEFYNSADKTSDIVGVSNGQIWSGAVATWSTITPNATESINSTDGSGNSISYDPDLDLIVSTYGALYGVFSCNTTLSEVTYTADDRNTITNVVSTPMNDTAAAAFLGPFIPGYFGVYNFNADVTLAGVTAVDRFDLAAKFARAMDRSILGVASGNLESQPPVQASLVQSIQVAKVPVRYLVSLIVLELVLSSISILMSIRALLVSRKKGVSDVQMRLGYGALVAGLLENEKLNEGASRTEDLYAELRDMPTKRVWIRKPSSGVTMFHAVDEAHGTVA